MKKIFTRRLFIYMLTAFIITVTAIFAFQTVINQRNNTASSRIKLEDVKQKLINNEKNIENLTENLSEDNLAKARAFADMLAMDKTIFGNIEKLNKIKDRLKVNELHIIDEKGIIVSSTIDAYIGFDMSSGEQSGAFMAILDDPTIEIAQEPQVNVAEGIVMQYIGVTRTDAKGFVQVGVRPEILEDMLMGTEIETVLKEIDFGKKGYIYAIDAASGRILAHPDSSLIGMAAADAGFPSKLVGNGRAKIHGVDGFYVSEEFNGQVIGTFMPEGEYYEARVNQSLVVSFSMLIIFVVLLFMINRLVDGKIVHGIHQISDSVKKIAGGNFSIVVNEHENPEFSLLSDSINKMVESICHSMQENEKLLDQQKIDMENNRILFENVKNACTNLDSVSGETLENANNIYQGTGEQERAVADLKQVMAQLTEELSGSVETSVEVAASTGSAAERIQQTQGKMELLKDSMQKISEMSKAIETIIEEINSIAQQTNMLSLNASIEAARAGEMGKGFAVVATQVGELAARSAQAARETTDLITNSIRAVENGKEITAQTADAFDIVVEKIEMAGESVKEITSMVRKNVDIVSHAVSQIERISHVVKENVQISENTKQVSANMAEITGELLQMVE